MSVAGSGRSLIEMQFVELSVEYQILSLENVECLTPKTFARV